MSARLKINFFTPLPPARTEIANVNVPVLKAMAEEADVSVWVPQEFWLPVSQEGIQVRPFRSDAIVYRDLQAADANVFQIGNNASAHQDIYDVAVRVPGLVVLHDPNLHHLMLEMLNHDRPTTYFEALERCHGPDAVAEMRDAIQRGCVETLMDKYPMTLAPARVATGLLVHNQTVAESLKGSAGLPVDYLPLPYSADEGTGPSTRAHPRLPYRLIVFGYLGVNRRVEVILKVLAGSPFRAKFRLDIYGTYFDPSQLRGMIAEYDLQAQVEIHGFVSDDRLDNAISEADLAINLRRPSVGEASASQLRIWANGTPSLVSRTHWYATLPEDCCRFIGMDTEEDDLHRALLDFCCDPQRFYALGVNGWRYVRQHHRAETYARELLAIAGHDRTRRVRRLTSDANARISKAAFGSEQDGHASQSILRPSLRQFTLTDG